MGVGVAVFPPAARVAVGDGVLVAVGGTGVQVDVAGPGVRAGVCDGVLVGVLVAVLAATTFVAVLVGVRSLKLGPAAPLASPAANIPAAQSATRTAMINPRRIVRTSSSSAEATGGRKTAVVPGATHRTAILRGMVWRV